MKWVSNWLKPSFGFILLLIIFQKFWYQDKNVYLLSETNQLFQDLRNAQDTKLTLIKSWKKNLKKKEILAPT